MLLLRSLPSLYAPSSSFCIIPGCDAAVEWVAETRASKKETKKKKRGDDALLSVVFQSVSLLMGSLTMMFQAALYAVHAAHAERRSHFLFLPLVNAVLRTRPALLCNAKSTRSTRSTKRNKMDKEVGEKR
jgi:hypothetical protein